LGGGRIDARPASVAAPPASLTVPWPERRLLYAVQLLVLAGVYVGAAKLGLALRVAHGVITPVWAPTGLAIAALVLFGTRLWPGVAIGALVANATSGVSVPVATGIAVGNTLEALTATYLLRRVGFDGALARARDVLLLVAVACLAATTVSATIGTVTLAVSGNTAWRTYGDDWLLWWFGDLIGALVVTPLVLVWARRGTVLLERWRLVEGVALLAALGAVGSVVFFGGRWQYPYVLFPLLVWAALRFGQRGAVTAVFLVTALGIGGTLNGAVAIGGATETQTVQILQALIAVVAVSLMIVAAAIEERELAIRVARDAEDLKAKFLSMATHEMRTPLAVTSGYAALLLEHWAETTDAEKHTAVERMADQSTRLGRLVDDLLATSRIDERQLMVRTRELHLNQVVAQVMEDVKGPPVTVNDPTPLFVMADRDHVEQILVNYLSNAFKYGAAPFRLDVSRDGGAAVIRMCDGGDGVPDAFVPRLFERFSRGPSAVAQGVSGTGLGLAIVRELARAQGGEAWYEHNQPKGACFCLRLPLAEAD
jgi:signal transduction histidine kinase